MVPPERLLALLAVGGPRTDDRIAVIVVDGSATGSSVSAAVDRSDSHGLVALVTSRRTRRRAMRLLVAAGLVPWDEFVAVPRWPSTHHVVAVHAPAVRDLQWRARRRGARLAASLAGTAIGRRVLFAALPSTIVVGRDPCGPAPASWVADAGDRIALSLSARTDSAVATLTRYPPRTRGADLVVKVGLDTNGRDRVARERDALAALGPSATTAGAKVPAVRHATAGLAMDVVPGRPASALVDRRPRAAAGVATAVSEWLRRWNVATARRTIATTATLETLLIHHLGVVEPYVPAHYVDAVASLGQAIEDSPVITVATHGDLTLSNVLVSRSTLGIVDWEEGSRRAFPLTDLWYLLVDVESRRARCSRASALARLTTGAAPGEMCREPAVHAAALGLSSDAIDVAFHATWLLHASNEVARGSVEGPFLSLVRDIASGRVPTPNVRR
jgi:hypothetical protein